MIPGSTSHCFPSVSQGMQMFPITADVASPSIEASSRSETPSNSLLYSISLLKDKVHQVQSMVNLLTAQDQSQTESASKAIASMGTMIQEIIVTASSMMFTCQQLAIAPGSGHSTDDHVHQPRNMGQERVLSQPNYDANNSVAVGQERGQSFFSSDQVFDWYGDNYNATPCNNNDHRHLNNNRGIMHATSNNNSSTKWEMRELPRDFGDQNLGEGMALHGKSSDIIELDAANLLAKYTHYCHVCGKGFKRDANLRMHMRAHGDEYKTSAALSNPMKNNPSGSTGDKDSASGEMPRKYSCPQEGCRWNQKHAKFQPLKSMICVKNHYKRSHCPKMYVCKRCNRKHFSVLSDLRTHEKHCGDLKWQCSCGTTFSRKDKLMGHVALFVGHTPAISTVTKPARRGETNIQAIEMQPYDRG